MEEKLHPVGSLVQYRESASKMAYAIVIKSESGWKGRSDHDIFNPETQRISYGWEAWELLEVKEP